MYMACIYVEIFRTSQSALNFVTLGNTHTHTSQICLTHHPRSKLCVKYMLPQHGTCLFSDRWYVTMLERANTVPEDQFFPRCCVLASRLMKVCVGDRHFFFCLVNHVACARYDMPRQDWRSYSLAARSATLFICLLTILIGNNYGCLQAATHTHRHATSNCT